MKLMSNKSYNLLQSQLKARDNDKEDQINSYKKQIQEYEYLCDEIYEGLKVLRGNVKSTNISKKTVIGQIDHLIKKLGGKI